VDYRQRAQALARRGFSRACEEVESFATGRQSPRRFAAANVRYDISIPPMRSFRSRPKSDIGILRTGSSERSAGRPQLDSRHGQATLTPRIQCELPETTGVPFEREHVYGRPQAARWRAECQTRKGEAPELDERLTFKPTSKPGQFSMEIPGQISAEIDTLEHEGEVSQVFRCKYKQSDALRSNAMANSFSQVRVAPWRLTTFRRNDLRARSSGGF